MARVTKEERIKKLISFDKTYWNQGLVIAGIDEAGRGPLAGNVVAACVIMPQHHFINDINDSKKLSPIKREKVFEEICKNALFIGIGEVTPRVIDEINILQATKSAMEKASEKAPAHWFLVDGRDKVNIENHQTVIQGDGTSYSIAAASIIAKVTRDREMVKIDKEYPEYGFAKHKGYGTKAHIEAIRKHGPTPIHRLSFLKNILT